MISISINGEKQSDSNINQQWIAEQINNRRHIGQSICVIFKIRCGDVDVSLSGGDCPGSGNGQPIDSFNDRTQQVIRKWQDKGFGEEPVKAGMVISFWEYVSKRCN
jgi:hypothetical protein